MSRSSVPLPFSLGALVVMLVFLVLWFGWLGEQCSNACQDQYGKGWQGRTSGRDATCDCVGPDGTLKAPRR